MPASIVIPDSLIEFEGMSPYGGSRRTFRFPKETILKYFDETGNLSKYDEAFLVPETCGSPTVTFKGLDRSNTEECYCYVGLPPGKFALEHGIKIGLPLGCVFLVYTTPDLEVVKWTLSKEDSANPGFPIIQTPEGPRFGAQLWPKD